MPECRSVSELRDRPHGTSFLLDLSTVDPLLVRRHHHVSAWHSHVLDMDSSPLNLKYSKSQDETDCRHEASQQS